MPFRDGSNVTGTQQPALPSHLLRQFENNIVNQDQTADSVSDWGIHPRFITLSCHNISTQRSTG